MTDYRIPSNKFTIHPEEPSIDFSLMADFDPSLLQSVYEPRSRAVLFRNPAYLFQHFEWAGKKLILKQKPPIAYFGSTELECWYSPSGS